MHRVARRSTILRVLDVVFSLAALLIGLPVLLVLMLFGWMDTGSPIYRQERVGRDQKHFTVLKFRTMRVEAPSVASQHADPSLVTRYGKVLRRTKLDELPQFWNVLKGDMSIVGPRPCLPNQIELIEARSRLGVFRARPGITGLAQLKGIDMSTPLKLAQSDASMVGTLTVTAYCRMIALTLMGQGMGDRIH